MKPGKTCKKSGKKAYGSHKDAVTQALALAEQPSPPQYASTGFTAYKCPHCKCWHLATVSNKESY